MRRIPAKRSDCVPPPLSARSRRNPWPAALATATGDVANPGQTVANYGNHADWGGFDGNSTTVGGAGSETYYGCRDMGGNAFEWCDTTFVFMGTNRVLRGGSWIDVGAVMGKDVRLASDPHAQASWWGFRVARREGNPAQSLTVISGVPSLGTVLTLGIDNPLGTQSIGSLPFVAISTAPDPHTPYGTLLPGFSMLGPGHAGELLVDVAAPNPVLTLFGAPWTGPGSPAPVALAIPNDATLLGLTVHAQGLMIDAAPTAAIPFGLTNGLVLVVQP